MVDDPFTEIIERWHDCLKVRSTLLGAAVVTGINNNRLLDPRENEFQAEVD